MLGDINNSALSSAAAEPPIEAVKGGVDINQSRLHRENLSVQIRKQKKDEHLRRRRCVNPEPLSAQTQDVHPHRSLIPQYVQGVMSDDRTIQLQFTRYFRKLLSIEQNPPIEEVTQAGIVPRLVEFLMVKDDPHLQFEAAWALTNIASGTASHTKIVIDAGAVPIFVSLLQSPGEDVREQAVWALGNIAGDSCDCRDLVLNFQALPALLHQMNPNTAKPTMIRNATWTLSNFCRGKPSPEFVKVRPALAKLSELINSNDVEVLTDACWALSYLSDGNTVNIQAVIESGVAQRCIELLLHSKPAVKTPALRTVGNIVTGDDLQTQIIVSNGALPNLLALLSNERKGIVKEACWTISNITAGNKAQIEAIIQANIIPELITLLRTGDFDIKKEAAWAISNASSGGSPEHIVTLVDNGCIEPFCDLLKCDDTKIVLVALEGLENILKVGEQERNAVQNGTNRFAQMIHGCEGSDAIEELQHSMDDKVAKRAQKIIGTYFESEDDDDVVLTPAIDQSGHKFSFGDPPMPPSGAFGQNQQFGNFNFSGYQ